MVVRTGARLELVFSDPTYQITGVAKEPGKRLFVNYPRWSDTYRYAVAVATGDNHIRRTVAHRVRGEFTPGYELRQHLSAVFLSSPATGVASASVSSQTRR